MSRPAYPTRIAQPPYSHSGVEHLRRGELKIVSSKPPSWMPPRERLPYPSSSPSRIFPGFRSPSEKVIERRIRKIRKEIVKE
ncbi:hypothetical protein [Liberibacter crescens]|uniref:hypothetical protein n=1 Tax=Liberibacter crescens TaxID=1273132 RepID=UPI0005A1D5E5|nr:hypothetical protein [Liberibacter crescens]AMC12770.1 hypothetical protein RL73_03470 [Liberibacter crescens]